MTRKALELCELLAREAGMSDAEITAGATQPRGDYPGIPWDDWCCTISGGPIQGAWRTMRCVAYAAAAGDVQCLVRLRGMFGLPIF